ncbi:hypothetical protein MJD09_10500, partial [bacterium]|nr:hypothetical protein [bacterium]
DFGTDATEGVIVNEALVKYFGWQDPLNELLPGSNFSRGHRIIGVIKDFHYGSLHKEIEPLALTLNFSTISSGVTGLNTWNWPPLFNRVLVRISEGETEPIVEFLKQAWHKAAPQTPFELTFLDETIQAQYVQEERWSKIINYSSIFAILIACLGLFGLTMVAVDKRIKEIGIRKVLGASASGIVSMISKDLLLLVVISNIVAWPAAYFAAQKWLQNFAYRIDISVWSFVIASTLTLLIALMTVSSQAIKAALSNPIRSLRTE